MTKKQNIRSRRSFIFTPALKPEMIDKAMICGADMVCVELEDGVAPSHKKKARESAVNYFNKKIENSNVELILRINCIREKFGLDDIRAILDSPSPPPAIMLPKVKSPDEVVIIDNLLSESGHDTRLHVIVETNKALSLSIEIASCSDRIDALFFGGVDMAAELRSDNNWDSLLYARSRVVHAAASAEIDVIDVPFLDLNDLETLREEAQKAKELGFSGKGSIHPKQIPVINDVFTPSTKVIEEARKIIDTFEKASTGLVVVDGKLIEKPVLREMYKVLRIAEKIKK